MSAADRRAANHGYLWWHHNAYPRVGPFVTVENAGGEFFEAELLSQPDSSSFVRFKKPDELVENKWLIVWLPVHTLISLTMTTEEAAAWGTSNDD